MRRPVPKRPKNKTKSQRLLPVIKYKRYKCISFYVSHAPWRDIKNVCQSWYWPIYDVQTGWQTINDIKHYVVCWLRKKVEMC
jgi:hypothetical protein